MPWVDSHKAPTGLGYNVGEVRAGARGSDDILSRGFPSAAFFALGDVERR